jgi:hypothetical protein
VIDSFSIRSITTISFVPQLYSNSTLRTFLPSSIIAHEQNRAAPNSPTPDQTSRLHRLTSGLAPTVPSVHSTSAVAHSLRFSENMSDPFAPRSMKRKNVKGLALKAAAPRPPPTAETSNHEYSGSQDAGRDEQLEIGIEYKLDLRPEDLEILKELGSGNGGTVSKVKHLTTGTVMARKVIHVEAKREIRKRIVRELQIMHGCHSDYIVTFYGAFLTPNNDVIMCMEYMDVGSLDRVSRVFGPVRVDVLGKIC